MAKKSSLAIIFTTILIDLIGFGMILPLISLYGRHYGAQGLSLAILGCVYSLMQFIFSPIWGAISDRVGRRPVLLISILGLSISYYGFAFAPDLTWLIVARILGGIFAANISTAQAFIADVTTAENRTRGMGLLGAAFGIGLTLGPPVGGIAAAKIGLWAPGCIAGTICLINGIVAYFRLPETIVPVFGPVSWNVKKILLAGYYKIIVSFRNPALRPYLVLYFFITLSFAMMESAFAPFIQDQFRLSLQEASLESGLLLMQVSVIGAIIQGFLIKSLAQKFSERTLLVAGLALEFIGLLILPLATTKSFYIFRMLPFTIGSSLINPSLASLTSQAVPAQDQGSSLGVSQSMGSLARAIGPFFGLLLFQIFPPTPFWLGAFICGVLFLSMVHVHIKRQIA